MISVVIPSYNRRDSMLALLSDVSRQQEVDFEIIVVDDVSPDDSVDAIRKAFPKVRLFVNEKNGGPAVTRNRGIEEALGDIVVGFDSDVTVPDPLCLKKVQDTLDELPDAAGLAFRLLQPDGRTEDYARWWHPVPIKEFKDKRFETDYFSGTGYAFRTEDVRRAGMYPEILYMHYEEVELAYRVLDLGKSIVYTPKISVVHHEGQVSRRSEIKEFYKHRNQWLIAIACYPFFRALAYILPRTVFQFISAIKNKHLSSYFKALRSARELGSIRIKDRRPLSSDTWHRIASLKHGVLL